MAALIKSPGVQSEPFVLGQKLKSTATVAQTQTARTTSRLDDVVPAEMRIGTAQSNASPGDVVVPDPLPKGKEPISFDQILAQHQSKIDSLEADAVERGYAKGLDAGRLEGKAQYLEALRRLEEQVSALSEEAEGVVRSAEDLIGEIVFQAVGRIVGTQVVSRDGVLGVVGESIAQIKRSQILAIRMSPQDAVLIASQDESGGAMPGNIEFAGIPVQTDSSISLGGCVVEIVGGSLDARIETQFRQFAQSLKDYRSGK